MYHIACDLRYFNVLLEISECKSAIPLLITEMYLPDVIYIRIC